ncbi:MAG: hypothetical protein A2848_03535 [Candidatus Magasanikbacteria bacterium RIFCSPHIGHO2_01_FULL_50_8]|uniref:Polymerase nucleotidyl transferase domain-containing protein n=2 Tax=Candidatus Magasanikiibacteriota TaxID=1752731 RepID=A0A1F6LSK5_9BACT|nr:MAG: hypothetical protein A2848_03535 [Candidatus Magasanikbacteria bacterium RIFCSPHIGHO2_01_FULL_50_8]OGH68054.1 MAG: hypothetical protein A3C15_00495 [Candidatus Magasanikbacteria bacterium RIFCSPHIGHO2_02_FULL_50_9b]
MNIQVTQLKKRAIPTLKKYGVRGAFVFGSFSRGDFTKKSDVDLLIDFPPGASLFDAIGLQHELEKKLGRDVDVVSKRGIKPRFAKYIEGDLIRIL